MTSRAGCCHICHSNDKKWQENKWQSVGDGSWHSHSINGGTSLNYIQGVFNWYIKTVKKHFQVYTLVANREESGISFMFMWQYPIKN